MQATAIDSSNDQSLQFLTFRVEQEEYGVELLAVQEIRAFSAITPLPGSPPHLKGIINLRGVLIPVIGLRERFGLASVPYDRYTVIVVLHVGGRIVGVVVDAVSDVLTLAASEIDPSPDLALSCLLYTSPIPRWWSSRSRRTTGRSKASRARPSSGMERLP